MGLFCIRIIQSPPIRFILNGVMVVLNRGIKGVIDAS